MDFPMSKHAAPAQAVEGAGPQSSIAPEKWLVLGAVCLAAIMMPLSFVGPSVALPAIGREFGGSAAALNWVLNAFILSVGSSVMAAGALADLYGRKRMFRIGLIAFAVTSLGTALAPNLLTLDLLRAAQGIAGALAMVAGIASLAHEFEGRARTQAYSILGTSFGIGLAFGPIINGILVEALGWRSIFFLSVILAVLVLVVGVPRIRESRDPDAQRFDSFGVASFSATLLLLTFAIMQGPQSGWSDPLVIGLFIAAAGMLAAFIQIERSQERPMLDISLFTYPRFLAVQSLPIATAYSFVVMLVLIPARFIGVEGMSTAQAGLMMLPLCAPLAILPFMGALMTRWVSAGILAGSGLLLGAAGLIVLSFIAPGSGAAAFVLPLLMIGVGASLPWGLMDDLAVSVVPKERAGMATGIFGTMRVAGEAIAIAITSAILLAFSQAGLKERLGASSSPETIISAANRLVGGEVGNASTTTDPTVQPIAHAVQAEIYGGAFASTLLILATITVIAALIAILFVRRHEEAVQAEGEPEEETEGGDRLAA
jgi:MFS family permease